MLGLFIILALVIFVLAPIGEVVTYPPLVDYIALPENGRWVRADELDLGRDRAYRQRFDVATARAVAALPVLLEYVVPFLDVGGIALLPKGVQIADELRQGRRAAAQLGVRIVSAESLPLEATRLVVARKVAPTAAAYPRPIGVPSQTPLGSEP